MAAAGVRNAELARALDTNRQNITRWKKGERELPREIAEKAAPLLHRTAADIIMITHSLGTVVVEAKTRNRAIEVPLLARVPAGRLWATDAVDRRNVRKTLIAHGLPAGGDWIALEVDGDSMDKIAPEGAIIYVDRSDQRLIKDRFYVFQTEAGDSTFKRYRPDPPRLVPYSTNPDREPIRLEDEPYYCVGRVRRVQTDL